MELTRSALPLMWAGEGMLGVCVLGGMCLCAYVHVHIGVGLVGMERSAL